MMPVCLSPPAITLRLEMTKVWTACLASVAALGFAASTFGLTVVPTYDSSITDDPNGPAMIAAIHAAIDALQSSIADSFVVYMDFLNDPSVDLGENSTWIDSYSYQQYRAALRSSATDANDTNALSKLPNSPVDPVVGGADVILTLPLARHLGLDSGVGPDGFDSTIHLNMSLVNFSRPPTNSNDYDLQAVVAHEMDEVLGTSSGLPDSATISAMDLFRYTTNLERSYTTNGDNAYFSVDGTNLWARFNQASDGDYGDYWSATAYWAPPGMTPVPQVQDAFGDPGVVVNLGANELTMLDVVGWRLATGAPPKAPALSIAYGDAGQITLYWPANFGGFVLQESTNLETGAWVDSAAGAANPAPITIEGVQKFYRLNKQPPKLDDLAARIAAVGPNRITPLRLATHVLHTRKP
jgi:hypothetical protein